MNHTLDLTAHLPISEEWLVNVTEATYQELLQEDGETILLENNDEIFLEQSSAMNKFYYGLSSDISISEAQLKTIGKFALDNLSIVDSKSLFLSIPLYDSESISEFLKLNNAFILSLLETVPLDAELNSVYFIVRKEDKAFIRSNIY